jgi:phosphinothricin acetyltransferase
MGHGERLFGALMKSAENGGYHAVLSIACSENIASIKLAERHGFKKVGEMKEVGRKFERWLDVTFMEKILSER